MSNLLLNSGEYNAAGRYVDKLEITRDNILSLKLPEHE